MLGFGAISEDPISALPVVSVVAVVVAPVLPYGRQRAATLQAFRSTSAAVETHRDANASLSQQRGVSSGLNSRRASAPLLRK